MRADETSGRSVGLAPTEVGERPRASRKRPTLFVGTIPEGLSPILGTSFCQRASAFGYVARKRRTSTVVSARPRSRKRPTPDAEVRERPKSHVEADLAFMRASGLVQTAEPGWTT
jgi:hypothetical protein